MTKPFRHPLPLEKGKYGALRKNLIRTLTVEKRDMIFEFYSQGKSVGDIATQLNLHYVTVQRELDGVTGPRRLLTNAEVDDILSGRTPSSSPTQRRLRGGKLESVGRCESCGHEVPLPCVYCAAEDYKMRYPSKFGSD